MASRALAAVALFASSSFSASAVDVDSALAADDACLAGEECSVELRQLRGEMKDAEQQAMDEALELISQQVEENRKYETSADDESGATCHPEKGTAITCGAGYKCCNSKRSYLAGEAHSKQGKLALYAICCPLDNHCKHDTIFVSCAPGAGRDDDSGVLAGLVQEHQQEADVVVDEAAEDAAEYDYSAALADEEEEEDEDEEEDSELTGAKCRTGVDQKVWKSGGKRHFDAALNHCGRSCAAGFPCTKDCMRKRGYTAGCASCMADLVGCGRDNCLNQCISNDKSKACTHCVRVKCRPRMKRCSGMALGGK
jgi:hypothetical protein